MWTYEQNFDDCVRLIDKQFESFVVLFEFLARGALVYLLFAFLYHRYVAVDQVALEISKLRDVHMRLSSS